MKVLIQAQCWCWYGCEDNVGDLSKGRYKPKFGSDFVLEVEEAMALYGEEKIVEAFNRKYNQQDAFERYEALGVEPYSEPIKATLDL